MDHYAAAAEHMGGGKRETPKKEIDHITMKRSETKGDHVITHHHTHPEHHPPETHTTRGDDEMTQHILQNMGTANPGEATADPTAAAPPDPNAAAQSAGPVVGGPPGV